MLNFTLLHVAIQVSCTIFFSAFVWVKESEGEAEAKWKRMLFFMILSKIGLQDQFWGSKVQNKFKMQFLKEIYTWSVSSLIYPFI